VIDPDCDMFVQITIELSLSGERCSETRDSLGCRIEGLLKTTGTDGPPGWFLASARAQPPPVLARLGLDAGCCVRNREAISATCFGRLAKASGGASIRLSSSTVSTLFFCPIYTSLCFSVLRGLLTVGIRCKTCEVTSRLKCVDGCDH